MTNKNGSTNASRRRFLEATATAGITAIVAGCNANTQSQATTSATGTPTATTTETPPESPTGQAEQLDAYPRVRVASLSELSQGDVSNFNYPLQEQPNFVTKLGTEAWGGVGPDGDIVAFNAKCTHAGCSVAGVVSPDDDMAGPCPCHFTSFDLAKGGIVVMGQATTDLPQVTLEVEDGEVYATGMNELVWGYHDNLRNGTPVTES